MKSTKEWVALGPEVRYHSNKDLVSLQMNHQVFHIIKSAMIPFPTSSPQQA